MTIKIPTGPGKTGGVETVKDVADTLESQEGVVPGGEVPQVDQDAIARIAEQVAKGQITRTEAVETIMATVMDNPAIQSVPDAIKNEIREVLQAMLETDPHLKSLIAALGSE